MKIKGSVALLLVLALLAMAVPALAAQGTYVRDDLSYFSQEELEQLDARAAQIQQQTGVTVMIALLDAQALPVADDLVASAQQLCQQSGQTDAMLLAMTQQQWYLYCMGEAQTWMPQRTQEEAFDAMTGQSSWYDAMQAYLDYVTMVLMAAQTQDACIVDDGAGLLTQQQQETLLAQLQQITQRQACSVSVVTVNSLGDKSVQAYADDYYDQNGLGVGQTYDGLILLVDMQSRQWAISTCGAAISVFDDAQLEQLSEQFLPDLGTGDYFSAFTAFADGCDAILTEASGQTAFKPDGTGMESQAPSRTPARKGLPGIWIIISAGIGIVVSLITVSSMKAKLRSVRPQNAAGSYMRSGSFVLTTSRDRFLYRTVTKTPRPKDNSTGSGGGGSRIHVSSSGRSHGGASGRF